jgi:hypothetical protein
MKRTLHSQGWHELDRLAQQTHLRKRTHAGLVRVGHGIVIILGFLSLVGIVAIFN